MYFRQKQTGSISEIEFPFNFNGYEIGYRYKDGEGRILVDPSMFDHEDQEFCTYMYALANEESNLNFLASMSIEINLEHGIPVEYCIDHIIEMTYLLKSEILVSFPGLKENLEYAIEIYNLLTKDGQTSSRKIERKIKPGYVYLLQSPTGTYKIGKTTNPENRLRTFGVKLPFEVEYICLIKTKNPKETESELHNKFSDKRMGGEFFKLSNEDIEYVKSLSEESYKNE